MAQRIKQHTRVTVIATNILAFESETNNVLFYKRMDSKGRRNRALFYTINLNTGVQAELFHNPLAIQEIDTYGILF